MSSAPGPPRRGTGAVRKVLVGTAATAAAGVLGYAGARRLIRNARADPDLENGTDLSEHPGAGRRVASFDGTELAVQVVGPDHGPTLIMLHGFSGDLTLWHYQWKRFSKSFRCVLFDQRGHGRSGKAIKGSSVYKATGL